MKKSRGVGRPPIGKETRSIRMSLRMEPSVWQDWNEYCADNGFYGTARSVSAAVSLAIRHTIRTNGLRHYIEEFKKS